MPKVVFQAVLTETGTPPKESPTESIEGAITTALEKQLPEELREIFELDSKVKVNKIHRGSYWIEFTVTFGTIFAIYVGISRYKNFVESVKLIAAHAQAVLSAATKAYGKFSVSVRPIQGMWPLARRLFYAEFWWVVLLIELSIIALLTIALLVKQLLA
ncbi:MAG TPA: hypothetical protein VFV87_21435 [Pirellulaceae bacterium]|nr:hypothetical protein [Pirellulaceae bacterium]